MDLHPDEKIVFEGHPSWRGLLSFYVPAVAGAVAIGAIVALIFAAVAGVLVGAVLVGAVIVGGLVKRMTTRYLVTTQRLSIRRGIVSRRVQQTRIDRVQNVNTEQTLIDRLVRVGKVDFDTAGTDDSEFRFVGIAAPDAVVAAVDRAQRAAVAGADEPRFAHGPRTAG